MRLSAALGSVPRLLEGKVALVTAATDGIGLGVAEALGGAGARVFLSSRRPQNVQRALERLRGRGLQVSGTTCHVGRAEDRERMVQEALSTFGAIDILVSNAAVNPHLGPALEADERTWDKVFQVNVTAAAMLIQLVVPHMERRGGGAIVVMSSIAGYQPMAGLGPYSVSKTALLGLDWEGLWPYWFGLVCTGLGFFLTGLYWFGVFSYWFILVWGFFLLVCTGMNWDELGGGLGVTGMGFGVTGLYWFGVFGYWFVLGWGFFLLVWAGVGRGRVRAYANEGGVSR
uniref:Dehydrogenase/reductase SDR family member 4-like n=1 Tax=Taeniopygia guttata TaxID=59729 RepID=A0A674HKY7_TAEGU